jgi:hypothetical protein
LRKLKKPSLTKLNDEVRAYFLIWGELPRREKPPLLFEVDLAILCRSQNMCWFSEPTGVL